MRWRSGRVCRELGFLVMRAVVVLFCGLREQGVGGGEEAHGSETPEVNDWRKSVREKGFYQNRVQL